MEYLPDFLTPLNKTRATPFLFSLAALVAIFFVPFLRVKETLPVGLRPNLDTTFAVPLATSFFAEYAAVTLVLVESLTISVVTAVAPLINVVVPASLMQRPKLPAVGNSTLPTLLPSAAYPVSTTSPRSPRTKVKGPTLVPAMVDPVALATVEPPAPLPRVVLGNFRLSPALEAEGLVLMVPLNLVQPRLAARAVVPGSRVKVAVVPSGCPAAIFVGALATSYVADG